jgi:coenzyme F420-reducing hydrogenase gamma subunit
LSGNAKRIAFFEFADCGGCELALLNHPDALDVLGKAEIGYWLLMGKTGEGPYDITLVEGSVTSKEDLESLKRIREQSRILISLGADACISGIPGLKRFAEKDKVKGVYGDVKLDHEPIEDIGTLDHFVKVDYLLRGCPVNPNQAIKLLRLLVEDKPIEQGEERFSYAKARFSDTNVGRAIALDNEKCILCERCVEVCNKIVSALSIAERGINTLITPPLRMNIERSTCIACGQCTVYCPVSALSESKSLSQAADVLSRGNATAAVVEVETAVSIGELFGFGGQCHGKLVDALKRIGYQNVYLSSSKLLTKLLKPKPLGRFPAIIPCSYGARKFVEDNYPRLLQALAQPSKPGFAADVWIGPCTARKIGGGMTVLTTREAGTLVRDLLVTNYLTFKELEDRDFDGVELPKAETADRMVAEGAPEMRQVLDRALKGELQGSVIELWACPGGCITGGGQYHISAEVISRRREWSDSMGSALWRTRLGV